VSRARRRRRRAANRRALRGALAATENAADDRADAGAGADLVASCFFVASASNDSGAVSMRWRSPRR
jgi:hypothetical protein